MDHAQVTMAPSDGKPRIWDWMFLLLLASCLVGAAYVGVLAYREGAKTEATKRTGEAWLLWLTENGPVRSSDDYPHPACAARAGATWGVCQTWLLGSEGPFHQQRNAYADEPIRVTASCGGTDRAVAGLVALEKVTPLPPGAVVPFVVAPLGAQDSISERTTIRVVVCNKDASPIRVGEVEF